MITYEYECGCCHHRFEIKQSIKDEPLKKCIACNQHMLERIIFGGGAAFVRQEASTIGQLADRNTKNMGTYEKQEKRAAHKNSEKAAKKRLKEEAAAKLGGTIPEASESYTPIYGKSDKQFDKMSKEQINKYILEGK